MADTGEIYAVGTSGTAPTEVGQIAIWNGTAWSQETPLASPMVYNGVWGSGPSDVYVVGQSATVLRYNGSTWNVEFENPALPNASLAVWGDGTGRIYASSQYGDTYGRIGNYWMSLQTSTGQHLNAIAGNAAGAIYAVGDGGTVLEYQGRAWSGAGTGMGVTNLRSLWGLSADDLWAAGGNKALHFDGTQWMPSDIGGGTTQIRSISGFTSSSIYAVGNQVESYYWNGTLWNALPVPPGPPQSLMGVTTAAPSLAITVGTGGLAMRRNTPVGPWQPMNTGGHTEDLNAVEALAANNVIAVGQDVILHYDGNGAGTWTDMALTAWTLRGLHAVSPTNIFAVGDDGVVVHYDGTSWTEMESATTEDLYSVWAASSTDVFAVGASGTVVYYNGSFWTPVRSDETTPVFDVWGVAGEIVYFALGTGEVLPLAYEISF